MKRVDPDEVKLVNDFIDLLGNSYLRHKMGGLGGCKEFNENEIPENIRDLVLAYVDNEIDFAEAIILFLDQYRNTIN